MKTQLISAIKRLEKAAAEPLDKHLLDDRDALLQLTESNTQFPDKLEQAYLQHRTFKFFKSNHKLLFLGVILYVVFLALDIITYMEHSSVVPAARLFTLLVMLFASYRAIIQNKADDVISVTALICVLANVQVLVSSASLPPPYDKLYSLGVIPMMIYSTCVFRACFKHLAVISFVIIISYIVFFVFRLGFYDAMFTPDAIATDYSLLVLVILCLTALLGVYSAWLVEQVQRSDWLSHQMLRAEKSQQVKLMNLLHRRSLTDDLTKLFNRRYFDKQFEKQWRWHSQHSKPLSVLMLDIDWFKRFNDNYGHQKGDVCLQQISKILSENVKADNQIQRSQLKKSQAEKHKDTALLARYGGEEFIILLPDTKHERALEFAKLICQQVFAAKIPHDFSPLKFCTISIGVSSVHKPSEADKVIAMARIIKQADDALYEAKAQGKNRVISATSLAGSISIEDVLRK